MDFASAFTEWFILIILMLVVITTDARRQSVSSRPQTIDCSGKDADRAICRDLSDNEECGEHYLSLDSETFISSQWVTSSRNKKSCRWKFQTDEGAHLRVTCELSLPKEARCKSSHLLITDGNVRKSKLCGRERSVGVMSNTGVLNIISKIDRRRAASSNFKCTVRSYHPVPPTTPSSSDDDDAPKCKCGRVNRLRRIVGGSQVEPHEYPWQVALVQGNSSRPYCGGSIISDSWILTAAHCLIRVNREDLSVVIAEHDWSTTSETNITRRLKIKHTAWHHAFTLRKPVDHDVGLIQLEEPLVFPEDNSVAPVCLPRPNRNYPEVNAVVVGWGTTEDKFSGASEVLRVADVRTMTNNVCQGLVSLKGPVSSDMICAGYLFSGENACRGDSGGPLLTEGEGCGGMCVVNIGIVSWGGAYCNFGVFPAVYTRTNRYLDWINMFIKGSNTCEHEQ